MTNNEDILKITEDAIKEVKDKIDMYNKYESYGKKLVRRKKACYYLECFLPYLLASFIGTGLLHKYDHSIFTLDNVRYYENVQEINYSNGINYTNRSETERFPEYFYTSTPWVLDESGNYTREEVYYSLEALDNYEVSQLLNMKEDEIKSLFPVVNNKKYVKNILDEEDLKYDEDLVVVVKSNREYDEEYDRVQTIPENIFDIFIVLIITVVSGMMISKMFVKHCISNRINVALDELKKIDINECQYLLKIRQDNLDLLRDEDEKEKMKGSKRRGLFRFTK